MGNRLRVIHIEDSPLDAELVCAKLSEVGIDCDVTRVESAEELSAALEGCGSDVILADYSLPAFDGRTALAVATERCPDTPFIFVTGAIGEDLAIELIREGATDYLLKDRLDRLGPAVRRAVREAEERRRRVDAERALVESERRFRFMAETIPQMVWTTDATGSHDYFNQRWYDYTGARPGQTDGEGWTLLVHSDDLERTHERWAHSLATREPYEIEYRLRGRDGDHRWFLCRALPMRDEREGAIRWFGTCTDVDEQRRIATERAELLERERLAREQAEQASRAKDEFLAMVSHELRTPLNSMLGWMRLLRSGKLDEETNRRGMETLERNVRSQAQLIDDLLDVSRIVSGKLRLEVQPVEIAPVVQAAIDSVRIAADAKQIRVESILDPSAGPVSGDPERLQQVVWNLLSNAVKFTPKGGKVQVRLARVDSHVEIVVADTGPGISPEFLPYVFERFRQADNTVARSFGGLGLGLAIVRHIVELHGGSVRAASEGESRGATFSVRLPLMPIQRAPEAGPGQKGGWADAGAPFECPPELAGVRVLVVDDEADTREMLTVVLESCDAVVRTAGSVAEALDLFDAWPPDILVSDIGMPGEDGYVLIRTIREREPGKAGHIPAVALTAFARYEDRMKALASGFQMHVAKPVEPSELVMVLHSMLGMIGKV